MMALSSGEWHKSSYSNGSGGNNCVEAQASRFDNSVLVRHSRYRGSWMAFTRAEWEAFVAGVKAGEFDLADGASPARDIE